MVGSCPDEGYAASILWNRYDVDWMDDHHARELGLGRLVRTEHDTDVAPIRFDAVDVDGTIPTARGGPVADGNDRKLTEIDRRRVSEAVGLRQVPVGRVVAPEVPPQGPPRGTVADHGHAGFGYLEPPSIQSGERDLGAGGRTDTLVSRARHCAGDDGEVGRGTYGRHRSLGRCEVHERRLTWRQLHSAPRT